MKQIAWNLTGGLLIVSGLALLYCFNPETTSFYPACPTYRWWGWSCATCGGLRAVHHLLHGQWAMAWSFNPLVVVVMVLAAAEVIRAGIWGRSKRMMGALALATVAAMLVFTVARNLY